MNGSNLNESHLDFSKVVMRALMSSIIRMSLLKQIIKKKMNRRTYKIESQTNKMPKYRANKFPKSKADKMKEKLRV